MLAIPVLILIRKNHLIEAARVLLLFPAPPKGFYMSEVYPSDSELNSLLEEVETGVEYIPTGTVPYHLHFRKLLYRLLLAAKRSNDLRVYDEGGLIIGVKAGKFWNGTTLVSYAGSSGNTLETNKANIYVYIDSSGTLVTDEYTAFPDMDTAKHVRLAVISTNASDITSITDARDHHSISVPTTGGGGGSVTIESHTADDTLLESESGSVHSNLAAVGIVTFTLPAAATAGTKFTFACQAAQQLRVDPGTAAIRDNNGQTADKYKYSSTIGACITLVADENGDWITVAKNGTWMEEV